jgi:sulfhydrogenase subunit alpha
MASDQPETVKLGLRLKQLGNTIQEAIGGRAIHPINAVAGGFSQPPDLDALIELRQGLQEALEKCDVVLEMIASLPAAEFCHANTVFAALKDEAIAVYIEGAEERIAPANYRALTNERETPFSNAKHSYYRGRPFMVGALARLTLHQDSLAENARRAMAKVQLTLPSRNPMDNNKAQAVELVTFIERALEVVEQQLRSDSSEPIRVAVTPRAGTGTAVVEAPRGLLAHSYTFDDAGLVVAADVITPTAMNAASVEHHFRRVVEQDGAESAPELKRKLEMVARAYDPCISCSVHLVQKGNAPAWLPVSCFD